MKTIEQVHKEIQAALNAARKTHEYRTEGASIEFTNDMVTQMREAGVSRSELARTIGVTPAYISKLLRGATNFTLDTMVKIATALDCEFRCSLEPSGRRRSVRRISAARVVSSKNGAASKTNARRNAREVRVSDSSSRKLKS